MTSDRDRHDFMMGQLLAGAMSNPSIMTTDALVRGLLPHEGRSHFKIVVDACRKIADDALNVDTFQSFKGVYPTKKKGAGTINRIVKNGHAKELVN